MMEIFTEFMDKQIYYDGFTADLLSNNQERFWFEYAEFLKWHK